MRGLNRGPSFVKKRPRTAQADHPANTKCSWCKRLCSLLCSRLELSTYRSTSLVTDCCDVCQTLKSSLVSSSELVHLRTVYFATNEHYYITIQWPSLRVISHNTTAFGANCVKFAEAINPYCQRQKSSTENLVSAVCCLWQTMRALCGSWAERNNANVTCVSVSTQQRKVWRYRRGSLTMKWMI